MREEFAEDFVRPVKLDMERCLRFAVSLLKQEPITV